MNRKPGITVLVTGFGPFDNHSVNISWEVAKVLPSFNLESYGVHLILQEVPVAYSVVDEQVPLLWKKYQPQLVVHMGLTSVGTEISLETNAHKCGYTRRDVFGNLPENGSAKGKYEVLATGLNAFRVSSVLNNSTEIDVPVKVSSHAGRYLCTDKGFTVLQLANVIKEIILLLIKEIKFLFPA